jgi:hypothetical protein
MTDDLQTANAGAGVSFFGTIFLQIMHSQTLATYVATLATIFCALLASSIYIIKIVEKFHEHQRNKKNKL